SHRCCEVQTLAEGDQRHVPSAEVLEESDEMLKTAPQAIQTPNQDRLELSALRVREHLVQLRAAVRRAADSFIAELSADLPTALNSKLTQIAKLHLDTLTGSCAHAAINAAPNFGVHFRTSTRSASLALISLLSSMKAVALRRI